MTREQMLAPFAEEELRQFEGRGKKVMTFIEDETVMDRLDVGYGPGNWQVLVEPVGTGPVVKVKLGVREGKEWVWYEDFGYPNQAGGDELKESVSDGIRRCGRFVGIARDLYRKSTYEPGGSLGPGKAEAPSTEDVELLGNIQKAGTTMKGGPDLYQGTWRQTPEGPATGFKLKLDGDDRDIPQVLVKGDIGRGLSLLLGDDPILKIRVTVKGKLYNVRPSKGGSFYRLVVESADRDFIEGPFGRVPAEPELVATEADSVPAFSADELADIK